MNREEWMDLFKKINWKELIFFTLGFILVSVSSKMTPQWVEFQSLSRPVYLTISIITTFIGMLFFLKPLTLIVFGKISHKPTKEQDK